MRILSPISKREEVIPVIEAGADELYCGIIPSEWAVKYGAFDTLNRREGYKANFSRYEDLKNAIALSHLKKVPIFVTLNGLYSEEQYPLLRDIVIRLKEMGADGLIIADVSFLLLLREMKIFKEIHMGTGGTTFNARSVDFYKELGVSRVILPRHLTVAEIKDISGGNKAKIDLEVFILNTLCANVDGFCTFYHGLCYHDNEIAPRINRKDLKVKFFSSLDFDYESHGCYLKYSMRVFNNKGGKINGKVSRKQIRADGKECGACAAFDFNKMNIKSLKIVERSAPTDVKVRDTNFIRSVLNLFKKDKNLSKWGFIKKAQKQYCHVYKRDRCSGLSCYYPSVFSKNK